VHALRLLKTPLHGHRHILAAGRRDAAEDARSRANVPLPPGYRVLFRTLFAIVFPAFGAILAILWLMGARPQIGLLG
jgi:uncharacterized membrane protein